MLFLTGRKIVSIRITQPGWVLCQQYFFLSLPLLVPDAISLKTTWWCRETPEEKDKARERRYEEEKGIEEDGHMRVEKGLIQMHYGGEGLERGGG